MKVTWFYAQKFFPSNAGYIDLGWERREIKVEHGKHFPHSESRITAQGGGGLSQNKYRIFFLSIITLGLKSRIIPSEVKMSNTSHLAIKGPGLLYVNSKIARTDLLDEERYMKWYGQDHIAEILLTSGFHSAVCFKDINAKADKPYLVMYPMEDIAFTQGEEFKKIKVHSDLLPNGGPIYDLADFEVRYYGLVQKYEPKSTKPGELLP